MKNKIDKGILIVSTFLILLSFFALLVIKPEVKGDSVSYVEAINFMQLGEFPDDFVPYRIITTFGGLLIVSVFSKMFGSIFSVWLSMNHMFYAIFVFAFYYVMLLIFNDRKVATLGSLFVASNYAIITFGLHYLMDMGGWMFYMLSLLLTLKYVKSYDRKYLLMASIAVGIGGLFKEYALLAVIPIATLLLYENRNSFLRLVKNSYQLAVISSLPIAILYLYVYLKFGYTYADWVPESYIYEYSSNLLLKVFEYLKTFGYLYNVLAVYVALGLWSFWKDRESLDKRVKIFLLGSVLSVLPIFLWGGVTQRIFFISVPIMVIFAGFFFKSNQKYAVVSYITLGIYLVLNLIMDSYLLDKINLPF